MSDDEDYMSDKFLQGTKKYMPPSLLYRHSDKRDLELMKKKAEIEARLKEKKNAKTIEQENRDEGLSLPIASSNKGFEMLMKMGYKPGHGIGKTESGIVEPIGIDVKTNRHGVGKAAKRKAEIEARLKENGIEQEKRDEGLSSPIASSNKGFQMLMKMGYKPGQGVGKTESGMVEPIGVDVQTNRHGLGKAVKKKSKPEPPVNHLSNEKINDFRSRMAQKKSDQLVKADLHRSQKVCEQLDIQLQMEEPIEPWFWLPKVETNPEEEKPESDEEESEEEEDALPLDEKLEMITRYLRKKHYYCIWCGVAYDDEDDLRDNCPGDTRNDH